MKARTIILLLLLSVPGGHVASAASEKEPDRYWAWFADGSVLTGERPKDWQDNNRMPSLNGRGLFETGSPVRILRDTTLSVSAEGPRVFFANGDVLTGTVVGYLPPAPVANLPGRLVVSLSAPLAAGGPEGRGRPPSREAEAQVRPHAVWRIVLTAARPHAYRGGAVYFRDGKRRAVRAIRWTRDGLKALDEDEIISATFRELAEIHCPKVDQTAAVLLDSSTAELAREGLVGRINTVEGAVLTYQVAAREIRYAKYRRRHDLYETIRPAWSLTPLSVADGSVCVRSFRRPTEIPLSLLPAETLAETSFTGFLWPWRRNQNVRGELLQCASYCGDLGFGTHSYSEVAFDLPPGAGSFSCYVGLDRAVGAGGCVRCKVLQDSPTGHKLWSSDLMIGSRQPVRVGPLDVRQARRLVFVAEFAHDDRPEGADPGDIRDEVDWLLPLVTVDASAVTLKPQDVLYYVPAWEDWSIPADQLAGLKITATPLSRSGRQPGMDIDAKGLTLTRRVNASPQNAIVDLSVARGSAEAGHVIELLVDGKVLQGLHHEGKPLLTRTRGPGEEVYQRWHLGAYYGREVELTLRVRPDPEARSGRGLIWRGLGVRPLVANLPDDGQIATPDVPLSDRKPSQVTCMEDGRRPRDTKAPQPASRQVHGLNLPDCYLVQKGMRMTWPLEPAFHRFVAVVGSDGSSHRGPFVVLIDDKEAWRSHDSIIDTDQLEQAIVDIPPGAKTITLALDHPSATGIWAHAGFLRD